ncbi:hypothetical protein XENOCAPTIV_007167 [Xenoophorus captivus]|uniref:Uncharacterized protein n=1 Tax=Xenoophorus captivus TaxID=1517983 RepID=A0ABV0RP61_9TELE
MGAVQRDYHIPAVWADHLEEKVELRVKATLGEWANILIMPSYHTLATYQPLTSNFRSAYGGVVHDVMLRRLKKAAYKYAQEIERQVDELSAEEEEEEPPLPSVPRSTSKPLGKMSEQPTASSPEADVFREYKKIKTLVREKRSEESSEDYIKDVWPMITNATESDEAKKLWLSHVTAHPLDKQGTAQSHYERLVLDDEDSQIRRARLRMDGGQRLAPVWHVLKQTISPARYVKGFREVTKGRRGEIAFAKMPMQGTTVPQMDQAVISYDLEQQFYEERRKKETGQGAKPPTKASVKTPANPPKRPLPQGVEEPQRRFYGPPASQGPQKESTFLPREEYDKLSSEEKKALFESCRSGTRGPANRTGAQEWYKALDVPEVTEQKLKESDFSPAGKEKLPKIITSANVAQFKNDCGDLGPKYVHLIEGGVHPPVRQYPLNPGAVEEMDKIVKESSEKS